MDSRLFEGIMVPVFLPLTAEEEIVEDELAKHVCGLLDQGVNGILVPSGSGEFYALSREQRRHGVEIVARAVNGKVPVVCMVSDCGLRNVLGLIRDAVEAGADAAMANPPYYSPIDQETLRRFFDVMANESPLPIWLYHQPTHTNHEIEPETVAALAQNTNIIGIKASAWVNILYFYQVVRLLRDKPDFRILMGEDTNELSGLILGGHGMVSTLSNILPHEFVALWKAIKAGDWSRARGLQDRIMDVQEALMFRFANWQGAAKFVLQQRGIFSSTVCAEPCPVLSDQEQREIESLNKKLKLF